MFRLAVPQVSRTGLRGYATLREIEMRLKSIKNIEKITKTMKIVASTRLNKAHRAMDASRQFTDGEKQFYKNTDVQPVPEPSNTLIVVVSSDKGLCGSIHSQISKAARKRFAELNGNADLVTIGEKAKIQLLRTHPKNLKLSFMGVGKEAPTFAEAAAIVDEIAELGEYQQVEILYNKFVSGVSFEPSAFSTFTAGAIELAPGLSAYEIEGEGLSTALLELSLANSLLAAMAEGYASEISARRNAMDNASKNAGDMITRYSILYNRTRQAVITNELVDIITGASSLD